MSERDFVQLAFNLRNRVTDTLESSSILIYLIEVKGIYTQRDELIKTRNELRGAQKRALLQSKLKKGL